MIYSKNAVNILTALKYKGIGPAWIYKNWFEGINEQQIVDLLNKTCKNEETSTEDFLKKREKIIHLLESSLEIDGVVSFGDVNFPHCRGNVKSSEKPVVLFYKGDLNLLNKVNQNVAVIGVLKPENTIEEREANMVIQLVKTGYTILSGLALGCDSIAHVQTLDMGGKTIAVLPSTIRDVLPTQNKELAQRIVTNGGLLITEYYNDAKSSFELRGRYQNRDRLQAMFSDAIVLTASYDVNERGDDCGSRLAMEYARQYQIARYVMYNENTDINNPQFDLNRRILKEGDSQIITTQKINNLIKHKSLQSKDLQLGIFDEIIK